MLKEIRIHGRGGQGGVTAAELLARASFKEGKYVQAFPFFGAERRGAPVKAFARISNEPIMLRCYVQNPDYVIVLDSTLLNTVNVMEGISESGMIIVNSTKPPEELGLKGYSTATVDATGIAMGLQLLVSGLPIVNTTILGAFAKSTGEVKIESIKQVIKESWPKGAGEKNAKAAEIAYERVKVVKP